MTGRQIASLAPWMGAYWQPSSRKAQSLSAGGGSFCHEREPRGLSVRSSGRMPTLGDEQMHFGSLKRWKNASRLATVPAGAFVHAFIWGSATNDEAFTWLSERAYQEQSNILIYIKVFPLYDPLRGDPRFQDLVRRVGLN